MAALRGAVNGCKRPAGRDAGEPRAGGKRSRAGRREAKKSSCLSAALLGEDCEISLEQLSELLHYAALGKRHNAAQPSWCHIYHQSHLAGVVVIVLHEMSQLHFYRFYLQFKHLRRKFRHRFTLPPPPADFLASLCGEGASLSPQGSAQGLYKTCKTAMRTSLKLLEV